MIFPKLTHEKILQIDDKTRLDASESFATISEIKDILINAGSGFISVYSPNPQNRFLDWAFETSGEKEIVLKIVDQGDLEKEKSYFLNVVTEEQDALFSSDSDIFSYESELRHQIPLGKNSYKYAHRNSQTEIMRYLDGQGIRKKDGNPFLKGELSVNEYIREWSVFLTIINLLEDQRVSNADIFQAKKESYSSKLIEAQKSATLRLDYDQNGEIEPTEIKNVQQKWLTR